MFSPYRIQPDEPVDPVPSPGRTDADIVGVYAVVWLITLVKVALSAVSGEPFGGGMTLLCLLLVALPVLAREGIADLARRRRPR